MSASSDRPRSRVALLRGDDYHNLYLDALLRREFDVVAVVSEPGLAQRRALRRRGKWRDAIAAEYHLARRSIMGLNRRRDRFFAEARAGASLPLPPDPHLTVTSVNDPTVAEFVRASGADICVITCTTILNKRTIEGIGVDIINIHGGHLPDYRGCHCFFFALSSGNFDKIGSTIHFVNAGIDTGPIIQVSRPSIEPRDNAESLYSKAELRAAHLLCDWLARREAGEQIPSSAQAFRGRLVLRRHRLPHHDVIFALRRMTGALRLPTVRAGEQWERPAESAER
jgi:methionyl-tRNA formyltransferase